MNSDLEYRVCLCGCGNGFRVLKTNELNHFFNRDHAMLCVRRPGRTGKLARSLLATSSALRKKPGQKKNRALYYATELEFGD